MIEHVALILAVYARPATLIQYVTPSLVIEHIAPALSETCYVCTIEHFSPAYTTESVTTGVNLDTASFDQIAAEQESLERVQRHTVAQIVRVPAPQIQEKIVVVVKEVSLGHSSVSRLRSRSWTFLFLRLWKRCWKWRKFTSAGALSTEHCGSDCCRSCATACTCRQLYSACSSDRARGACTCGWVRLTRTTCDHFIAWSVVTFSIHHWLVNPRCSATAVGDSAPQVDGLFSPVNEFAAPVHQEQLACRGDDPESSGYQNTGPAASSHA